jgi:F-type H+-transporting ATPase subunit epsilon
MVTLHEGTSELETAHYAVGAGFAEVSGGKMVLIVDTCELEDDIDAQRAERSLERAKELLRQALRGEEGVDLEAAQQMKERAEARIKVAYLRGK